MTIASGNLILASDVDGISGNPLATAAGFNTALGQTLATKDTLITPASAKFYLIKDGARPQKTSWSTYGCTITDNVMRNNVNCVKVKSDDVGWKCAYITIDLTNFRTIHWTKVDYDVGGETIRIYPTSVGTNYNNTHVWDGSATDHWGNGTFSADISNLNGTYRVGIYVTYIHGLYVSQLYLSA